MSAYVTIVGTKTYRLSGHSHAYGGKSYLGRLMNEVNVEMKTASTDEGAPIQSLPLILDNSGAFFNDELQTLWGRAVTVVVSGVSGTFCGSVRSFYIDAEGRLNLTVTDDNLKWMKREIPDEVVRVSKYSDTARDEVGTPIPTAFGGSTVDPLRVIGILVDRVNFRYIAAAGPLQNIVGVLKDRERITEGFTLHFGTASQDPYPGFAYVEFTEDPRDEDGNWPEIIIEIVGIKFEGKSEADCRNPAIILYGLLTAPSEGPCGWGLGVSSSKLGTSFTQAVEDCDDLGFKLDGCFYSVANASYWIQQICLTCRGRLVYENGLLEFYIDKDSSVVKSFTEKNMKLERYGKWDSAARKNYVLVDYRYDVADNVYLSSAEREDSDSQDDIDLNSDIREAKLIQDYITANKIADYLSRLEKYGEERIQFQTPDFSGVKEQSVVKITRTDLNLTDKLFRVTNLSTEGFVATIEARSYSPDIFLNDTATWTEDPPLDPRTGLAYPPPSSVLGFTGFQDGDVVDLSWDKNPENILITYEIREGTSWDTGVVIVSNLLANSWSAPVEGDRTYRYMIKAVNKSGSYSVNEAVSVVTVTNLLPANVVIEWDELVTRAGTRDACAFIDVGGRWKDMNETWEEMDALRWVDVPMYRLEFTGMV